MCDSKAVWYTATRRVYYCRPHMYHGLSEMRVISYLIALCVECWPSKHSLGPQQYIFLQFQFIASHHRCSWWPLERVSPLQRLVYNRSARETYLSAWGEFVQRSLTSSAQGIIYNVCVAAEIYGVPLELATTQYTTTVIGIGNPSVRPFAKLTQ